MQNSTSAPQNPLIGITHGDFNGTSYEIVLKAYADLRLLSVVTPLLYGQSKIISYYKKNFGMEEFNYSLTRDARQAWNQKFNILNIVEYELKIDPGVPTELSGEMAVKSLKMASDDLRNGFLDALVLTPVNPSTMKTDKYAFISQMDFIASALETEKPLLMAVSDRLKIGMATSHIPLSKVPAMISKDFVLGKLKVMSDALKKDFAIDAPKIAVLGLNPHAGEFGLFGEEDEKVIKVAVDEARSKGLYAFGPFAADSFFLGDAWSKYDAVLAMYHDQAMLPFNLLSVDAGAYYLAGSQFVCTAPVADCDFELCNQNVASPDAFRKALYLACDILKHRKGE